MRFNLKVIITLFFVVLTACNEDKSSNKNQDSSSGPEPDKVENKLIFDVHIETTQSDEFAFFANDVFLNNSQFMYISIRHKLNNNETVKDLHFEFPKNIKPDRQVGFSLGSNNVKDVNITEATLSYGGTKFTIIADNLMDYFTANKFVEYDSITKTVKTKRVDNKYNPLLFVRQRILDSIQNVY